MEARSLPGSLRMFDDRYSSFREDIMFRKILLTLDSSDLSGRAIEHALGYAKAVRADVVAISVAPAMLDAVIGTKDRLPDAALSGRYRFDGRVDIEAVAEAARRIGVHCDTADVAAAAGSSLVDAVIEVCKRYCCDVIYISAKGLPERGTMGISSQDLAYQILERTAMPVLVFR